MTATQIDLDDELVERVKAVLGVDTKRAAVNGAMAALVERDERAARVQAFFDYFQTPEGKATIEDVEQRRVAQKERW